MVICSIEDCENPRRYVEAGWCDMHYKRWRRNGHPEVRRKMPGAGAAARFWEKVDTTTPSGCWTWTAGKIPDGYGHFRDDDGAMILAHRWAYQEAVGDIPEGLVIDHLCRNRACVNPSHLEPVTNQENIVRGDNPLRNRTHCKSGHEYTEANTRLHPVHGRLCRTCQANYKKASKARKDT